MLSLFSSLGQVKQKANSKNDSKKITLAFKDAAKKLTGYRKREFTAKVTEDYFAGSARQAEIALGWCRHSIQLGLHERRTGIRCIDNYQARGRHKSEAKSPNLGIDIKTLVDAQAQGSIPFFIFSREIKVCE
jgi:hypothetical protein